MKAAGRFVLRAVLVMLLVVLAVALYLAVQSQLTAGRLSDLLVYASLIMILLGALAGLFNLGYKSPLRPPAAGDEGLALPGEPPEHSMKEIFRAGTLSWFGILVGGLCFLAAIVVYQLF